MIWVFNEIKDTALLHFAEEVNRNSNEKNRITKNMIWLKRLPPIFKMICLLYLMGLPILKERN